VTEEVSKVRIKHLIVLLSLAQTALLVVLLLKFANLEQQRPDSTAAQEQAASMDIPPATHPLTDPPAESAQPLSESRLRQIVREELRAQLDQSQISPEAGEDTPLPASPEEYQYRLDAAMETLDNYLKRGEISNAEMADLQSEIAFLDKNGRRQMLSLLARTMSTGELKGQF
jgi:hypothetical protein